MEHFEIWGGYCDDAQHGASAEFLETSFSLEEAKKIRNQYQTSNRYAYIRDMNKNGEIIV